MNTACARLRAACLALLCVVAPVALPAAPAEFIAVVVGPTAPVLDADTRTLRDIWLKRLVIDERGTPVVALNLPPGHVLRSGFGSALWGDAPLDENRYWNERYFHGVTPPHVVQSEEAMLRFVSATPGAIGYVAGCHVDARVQVKARLPVPLPLAAAYRDACAH